eukprot:g2165.t1
MDGHVERGQARLHPRSRKSLPFGRGMKRYLRASIMPDVKAALARMSVVAPEDPQLFLDKDKEKNDHLENAKQLDATSEATGKPQPKPKKKGKKKPTPWQAQREILRTPPAASQRSTPITEISSHVYMPISPQERKARHERKLLERIAKREKQMEDAHMKQHLGVQEQSPSLFVTKQPSSANDVDSLPELPGQTATSQHSKISTSTTKPGSSLVLQDDKIKDEDWEDETFESDNRPGTTDQQQGNLVSVDPDIAELLSKLEVALAKAIEAEDFYSASQLQRIRPRLYRRGVRLTKLDILKRDAVAAEDFDTAIETVEKMDRLRELTLSHLRQVSIWRDIRATRKEREHATSHFHNNQIHLEEEKQLEIYNVGDFVEARLKKWDNDEWFKGQIVMKSSRPVSDMDSIRTVALPSSFEYSVRFIDPNMVRKFKFVGSTDIVGRIIEGILPSELRTSKPEPPMERRKGQEYFKRKKRDKESAVTDTTSNTEVRADSEILNNEKELADNGPEVKPVDEDAIFKIGQIVEAQLEGWTAYFGGRIIRYDGKGLYSVLFDDLGMQRVLRSRIQRRVVEGVPQVCIRLMERSRLEAYEKQYDILYGQRAEIRTDQEKEDHEKKLKKEEEDQKHAKRFFGRVGDIFEAKLPHWKTWYAGKIMSKDEALGLASIYFDDVRLEDGAREIKHGRVLEDIPCKFIRPIGTGRLRLYKDLKSSLKLLKRRLEAQKNIERNEAKGHFQNGAEDTYQKEMIKSVKEEEEEVDSDSESDTDVSSSDSDNESENEENSYVGDMPKVGSIVAATLHTRAGTPWKRAYCGVVTGINPPKILAKAKPLHQTMTKEARERQVETTTRMLVEGTSKMPIIDNRQMAPATKVAVVQEGEWSVDVKFDDYELAIEMEWPEGKLNRVIERLFRKDLCRLDKDRQKRYLFMKSVWEKRQSDIAAQRKQADKKDDLIMEDVSEVNEESPEFSKLSYFEKQKFIRKQQMDRFCRALRNDKGFFPVDRRTIGVPKLDEFGFPCLISDSDDSEEEGEEERSTTPPPFVIMR